MSFGFPSEADATGARGTPTAAIGAEALGRVTAALALAPAATDEVSGPCGTPTELRAIGLGAAASLSEQT